MCHIGGRRKYLSSTWVHDRQRTESDACSHSAGLNAGDEILQLNGKDSHSLNFSDMKAAFTQASLALTVNTLPSVGRRQLCYLPPRRSDAEEDLYTDIFSQSQGEVIRPEQKYEQCERIRHSPRRSQNGGSDLGFLKTTTIVQAQCK